MKTNQKRVTIQSNEKEGTPIQSESKKSDQTPRLGNFLAGLSDSAKKLLSTSLKAIRIAVAENPQEDIADDPTNITTKDNNAEEEKKTPVITSPTQNISKKPPPP